MRNQLNFFFKLKKKLILSFLFKNGCILVKFYSILVYVRPFLQLSVCGERLGQSPESSQLTALGGGVGFGGDVI